MTHPDEHVLLLYAYGDTSETETAALEAHLPSCSGCREQLLCIERGRALADLALERPAFKRRQMVPVGVALAAAATIAGMILVRGPEATPGTAVSIPNRLSVPLGYVTGGPDLIAADSILGRLEREISHVEH